MGRLVGWSLAWCCAEPGLVFACPVTGARSVEPRDAASSLSESGSVGGSVVVPLKEANKRRKTSSAEAFIGS